MGDQKKKETEAGGGELEQLGPYRLREQVPQSTETQGELYRATHETSGATALVLKPAEEDKVPQKDWRVLLSASASARYVAMQVEQTPWTVSLERQPVESLVFTFEGVHEGVQHMARALSGPQAPSPLWRLGLSLASATAVCALLFALVPLAPESPQQNNSEPLANTPPLFMSHDVQEATETTDPFSSGSLVDTLDAGESVLARPLPREPFKGQKRPPCTRYAEVEIIGACWTPHKLKAPCPDVLYEYQGECYVPAFSAKPPPQSIGQ